jgi:hypothetical protein
MIKLGIFLILSFVMTNLAMAEDLGPARLLRKTSRVIRGIDPSEEDRAGLQEAISKNNVPAYISLKAAEYLKSIEHVEKMTYRLEALFNVKTTNVPIEKRASMITDGKFDNSMNEIFQRVILGNLSWDTLLTSKQYYVSGAYLVENNIYTGDQPFLNDLLNPPQTLGQDFRNNFSSNDERVAGVLTTARWWARYRAGIVNENRRHAAAVFRIFLCNPMKPAILPEDDIDKEIIKKILDLNGKDVEAKTMGEIVHDLKASEASMHNKPECMGCHRMLDPMGSTFKAMPTSETFALNLKKEAAPGALVFTAANKKEIDLPASGIGELAEHITRQDEYLNCQVENFWNWFMTGVPLTDAKKATLVKAFDSPKIGRRPNDFIAHLITQPEFAKVVKVGELKVTFNDVKPILNTCFACHKGFFSAAAVDLTKWPIGGSEASGKMWAKKIKDRISLPDSSPLKMPMKPVKLSTDEQEKLMQWSSSVLQE